MREGGEMVEGWEAGREGWPKGSIVHGSEGRSLETLGEYPGRKGRESALRKFLVGEKNWLRGRGGR